MHITIYLRKYIVFLIIVFVSSTTVKKESHLHNKWLIVNVTCLNDTVGDDVGNLKYFHKRAIHSSSNTLKSNDFIKSFGNEQIFKNASSDSVDEEHIATNESSLSSTSEANDSAVIFDHENDNGVNNELARISAIINCDSFNMNSDLMTPSVKHLRVKSYGSLRLKTDWASDLSNLTVLNINAESGLILLSNDSCSWLPSSISTLDLTQTTLNTLSMSDCPISLKKLYLQGTNLSNLTLCLNHLEELDASWNLLKGEGVDQSCEEATASIKALKLHNNEMSYWTSCGWPALTHLELQKNEISRVDFNSCEPHNIVEVNLSNNKLKLQPHPLPSKLTSIKLSHNFIEETFHFPRTIQEINLSHNLLTKISKGTFRSAFHLLSLDLSYNHLQVIYGHDFAGLRALRYLDLSHNAITHIRHEAFHPLRHIINLNINNNKIQQLDSRLISNLPNNIQFRIHNNPWHCGCHLLASLSKASKYLCKPNCHQQPELTCYESETKVLAQNILKQCLDAVQETDTKSPAHRRHHLPDQVNSSDEDTSEEQKDSKSVFSYYMIIPIVALFIGIPLVGLAVRTLYLNRKSMKRCCSCIANNPNVRWTPQRNIERDSDSETEF